MLLPLLVGFVVVLALLWRSAGFDRRILTRGAPRAELARVVVTFAAAASVLAALVLFLPDEGRRSRAGHIVA